jgi:2-C-methyl-D-erythritol 2,4-cyclodiphosphate synthase
MIRIGHGFDAHAFADGRPLVVGGVTIPHERGLAGHSDADVLLHAICDALLGAAALGDIGAMFPDNDERYRNISSRRLLGAVVERLVAGGFSIVNIDATLVAQAPRFSPHIDAMRSHIAEDCGLPVARINVKATTTEGMGFTGRREGIAAHAVALIEQIE